MSLRDDAQRVCFALKPSRVSHVGKMEHGRRRSTYKARLGGSQFGVLGRAINGGGLLSQSACSLLSQDLLPYPAYLQDQFVPLADLKLALP